MPLAALIAAYHESAEPGTLRATLPLAGRTVIERQARLAAAAGAASIIVFAERMPPALGTALDRLRRERLPIRVVRNAEEAAAAVDPGDRVLLMADGAIADSADLARFSRAEKSAVLTVPDGGFGELYERIDASTRWGGIAGVDGALLQETASMLRDWDLQSTVLRRALQSGAESLPAEGPVAILDAVADLEDLERKILSRADETHGPWASRLMAPLERTVTHALMSGPVVPSALGTAAAVLTGIGAVALAYSWLWTGLILMLIATTIDGTAARLAQLRMQEDVNRSWWFHLLPFLAGGGLAGLSYALMPAHGWGMVLLAFTTLAFLIAMGIETESRTVRGGVFLAERKGMTWLMLPFAIFGAWQAGMAMLFAYAAGSFFWAQREVHTMTVQRQD